LCLVYEYGLYVKRYTEIQIQIERRQGWVGDFSMQPETKMAHPDANLYWIYHTLLTQLS